MHSGADWSDEANVPGANRTSRGQNDDMIS
jgi:hypothetical protein